MKKVLTILMVAMLSTIAFSAQKVKTTKATSLYKNQKRELYEKALYTTKKGEILTVLKSKGGNYQVKTSTGVKGWVMKSMVTSVGGGKSARKAKKGSVDFDMDEAKVIGFLENPQAVYIMDMGDPDFKPIKLDRSFAEDLEGNIDKETNQRTFDPSLEPEL